MSLSNIKMTDLYFTMDGRVLLSIGGNLLSLERIIAPEESDLLQSILSAKGISQVQASGAKLNEIAHSLIADSQLLYDLVRARAEPAGEVWHDNCVYYFSRLEQQASMAPDDRKAGFFHLRRLEAEIPDLSQMGFSPGMIWHMEQACQRTGLVIAAGAVASRIGVLSSLMSLLLRTQGKLAWTAENPPSYRLAGLYHNDHNEGYCVQTRLGGANGADKNYAAAIKDARQARAHYIFVDKIASPECAAQVLISASSGHLVLSAIGAEVIPDSLLHLAEYAAPVLGEALARSLMARSLLVAVGGGEEDRSMLFAGPANSAVRGKIAAGKWAILMSDIENQMGRIQHGQPLFA